VNERAQNRCSNTMLATLLSTLHAKAHTNRLLGGQSAMLISKVLTLQDTTLIGKRSEKSDVCEGRSNVCSDLCEMMMRH
jgi:hypothetical protein